MVKVMYQEYYLRVADILMNKALHKYPELVMELTFNDSNLKKLGSAGLTNWHTISSIVTRHQIKILKEVTNEKHF